MISTPPPRPTAWLTLGAATSFVVAVGFVSTAALVVTAIGAVVVLAGLFRSGRRAVDVGGGLLFAGSLAAGVTGGSTPTVVFGAGAGLATLDLGRRALDFQAHLGRVGERTSGALAGVATAIVGALSALAAVGIYRLGAGGHPPTVAVVLLVIAGVVIAVALS